MSLNQVQNTTIIHETLLVDFSCFCFCFFFQPIRNNNKWNVLFFVAFLLLAGFVVLNMLVGVVVENFQKCRDIIEKDRLAEKEKKKAEKLRSGLLTQLK